MSGYQDLVEAVTGHARTTPDRPALIFSTDPDDPLAVETLTFAQLDDVARRIAALLARDHAAGDRILLLHGPGLRFAESFLGALYAGMIAVPAPLPDGYRRQRDRLAGIARDAGAAAILTDRANEDVVERWAADTGLADLPRIAIDRVELPVAGTPASVGPRTVAFLQYTSGSTNAPKGVEVDNGNIVANVDVFRRLTGLTPDSRIGGWLPMYHDFGLIGQLVVPMFLGLTSVLMSPTTFLKRPYTWFRLIDRYDVTLSSGPNFAYDLCTRRITDAQLADVDLSRLRTATNGSEPIQAATLRAFAERFAGVGFAADTMMPGYGMAETTLAVSACPGSRVTPVDAEALENGNFWAVPEGRYHIDVRELVSSGTTVPGYDIRIVDPAIGEPLPDDRIGEIWIQGPSVARGYWNRPDETRAAFGNTIPGLPGTYLRTGDLGVLYQDHLYVTGRIKELLIINGRNLYPQDIEADVRAANVALSHGVGVVFSVSAPTEEVVVVAECRARTLSEEQLRGLSGDIRRVVGREYGLAAANVVLVRPGTVPRTTSGKIQRGLARELFLDGFLVAEFEELTPAVRARFRPVAGPVVAAAAPPVAGTAVPAVAGTAVPAVAGTAVPAVAGTAVAVTG